LPLTNATGDASADWLADGLTESVIYKLSQMPNLKVIARSTVFRYKGRDVDAAQAARELGVRAILTGRVTQHGDDLTVSAELIDTREGKLLWGERYERKLSDANAVQQEIAKAVSVRLRPKMTGDERAQMAKTGTSNPEAYQLYLKGRFYWNKRTVADIKRSIEYFQQAIEGDPTFALAYAALADSYSILPLYDKTAPEAEDYQKARAAANKALEIDDNLAEAHVVLGGVNFYEWKFADAEKEFQTALRLNPNYATAHQRYGEYLSDMARHDEAIAELKTAQQLDPLSLIINSLLGVSYGKARQRDQAIEQLRKTIEMDQNFARAHDDLGFEYEHKRMFDEATAESEKADLLSGTQPAEQVRKEFAERRAAYKLAGWKGVWQKDLEIAVRDKPPYAMPSFFASRYALLGEKDKAFEYLEKAYQAHDRGLLHLKVNPDWDDLRDDPRFADLLRRVGLPQ
jgi:TolB-like protein/Tfp pilus assembly protein PilF